MVVVVLKVFVTKAGKRLAILARFVRATMLGQIVGSREGLVTQWADVWSLLCMGTHVPLEVF